MPSAVFEQQQQQQQQQMDCFGNGAGKDMFVELKNLFKSELKSELYEELRTAFSSPTSAATSNGSSPANGTIARTTVSNSASSSSPRVPPSIFNPIFHPIMDDAIRDVDGYFLQHWPFPDVKARKKFIAAGFSRVTCLYFPKAQNERIRSACKLLTILFLVDDQLEDMSLQDGEAYNASLMPFCRGSQQPDRSVPVQWMMYDIWAEMRAIDAELAEQVIEPVFTFMRAQTSKERLTVHGLGRYLKYRQGDVGQALLSALMKFSMSLLLTPADLDSVSAIELNCGRHISVVNDIYSYEKELQASQTAHSEGGYLCSAVPIFAEEADLSIPAAKRGLWTLVREWERVHVDLAQTRAEAKGGCSAAVRAYVEGLEYHMSGNEEWSKTTKRYQLAAS